MYPPYELLGATRESSLIGNSGDLYDEVQLGSPGHIQWLVIRATQLNVLGSFSHQARSFSSVPSQRVWPLKSRICS